MLVSQGEQAKGRKATISTSIDSSGEFFRLDLSKNGKTKTYEPTDLPSGVHSMDTVRAFAKKELKRM